MSASKETKSNAKEKMWYGKTLKEKKVRSYIRELPKAIETRRQKMGLNGTPCTTWTKTQSKEPQSRESHIINYYNNFIVINYLIFL